MWVAAVLQGQLPQFSAGVVSNGGPNALITAFEVIVLLEADLQVANDL